MITEFYQVVCARIQAEGKFAIIIIINDDNNNHDNVYGAVIMT